MAVEYFGGGPNAWSRGPREDRPIRVDPRTGSRLRGRCRASERPRLLSPGDRFRFYGHVEEDGASLELGTKGVVKRRDTNPDRRGHRYYRGTRRVPRYRARASIGQKC